MAKVIEVILAYENRGDGSTENPLRIVTQYFSKEGFLLVEKDSQREIAYAEQEKRFKKCDETLEKVLVEYHLKEGSLKTMATELSKLHTALDIVLQEGTFSTETRARLKAIRGPSELPLNIDEEQEQPRIRYVVSPAHGRWIVCDTLLNQQYGPFQTRPYAQDVAEEKNQNAKLPALNSASLPPMAATPVSPRKYFHAIYSNEYAKWIVVDKNGIPVFEAINEQQAEYQATLRNKLAWHPETKIANIESPIESTEPMADGDE